ncbi:hypothetical protein NW754_012157 [Fusarium falciforme]|nr:hypothetical protein NW754_012157 [Fusarium falciforme]
MSNSGGATARLRRTFHYPEEDSNDSQPEALDEQEQEDLIERLVEENAARNAQFRRLLLALPLLATIPLPPGPHQPADSAPRASQPHVALLDSIPSTSPTARDIGDRLSRQVGASQDPASHPSTILVNTWRVVGNSR